MTVDYVIRHGRYEEIPVPGRPLGRQKLTDSRSAAYPYQAARPRRITDVDHPRHIPTLNQGFYGSCEGDAEVGCAATSPLYEALPASHPALDQALAYRVYALATTLDGFPGTFTYPPPGGADTGTDSTSASKAAGKLGLFSGYLHAAALTDVLNALMEKAVNLAFDWYEGMDDPAPDGGVEIAGAIRGGHALCSRGVDAGRRRVWLDQSWGLPWGVDGRCYLTWDQLDQLLAEDGECIVPVAASAPPPVPVPVPGRDAKLWETAGPWCAQTRTRADLVILKGALEEWHTSPA